MKIRLKQRKKTQISALNYRFLDRNWVIHSVGPPKSIKTRGNRVNTLKIHLELLQNAGCYSVPSSEIRRKGCRKAVKRQDGVGADPEKHGDDSRGDKLKFIYIPRNFRTACADVG